MIDAKFSTNDVKELTVISPRGDLPAIRELNLVHIP
jgi:hypothetical protein